MNQQQLENLWSSGDLPTVRFRFGCSVFLARLHGPLVSGRVVALLSITPEPEYVIELPDGTSVTAKQSALEPAE